MKALSLGVRAKALHPAVSVSTSVSDSNHIFDEGTRENCKVFASPLPENA